LGIGVVAVDYLGKVPFIVRIVGVESPVDEISMFMVTGKDDGFAESIATIHLEAPFYQ
jgi:hypothetical protein